MNVGKLTDLVASGAVGEVEAAWIQAAEAGAPLGELAAVLEALAGAGHLDTAEALGWAYLEEQTGDEQPAAAASARPDETAWLEPARRIVSAVPDSDQLRGQAATMYRRACGRHPRFETILKASGLLSGQSPRRALRTLDVCLSLEEGGYVVNRFDHQAMRVVRYNEAFEEYELADTRGGASRLEPKKLADEFDPADPGDFRVLCAFHPDELRKLLQSDPAAVLVGMCMANGGQIDSNELKDRLVPQHLSSGDWSGWWSKARTAAKRSERLSLEGRTPVTVSYHPGGRTLEEEFDEAMGAASLPLERLAVLQQYLREAGTRRQAADERFVAPTLAALSEQAAKFQLRRPADALAASLALEVAAAMGLTVTQAAPSPEQVLASAELPAETVLELTDPSLWPRALEALAAREDATAHFEKLLRTAPADQLDGVAHHLRRLGREEALAAAVADAAGRPLDHLQVTLWLWKGPQHPPAGTPGRVELLSRLLQALLELDHDEQVPAAVRKDIRHQVRAALSASDFAAYKRALSEMSEGVAGTIKRLIERTDSLAQAVRHEMMGELRERFYTLFLEKKVEPWLDERLLWTTPEALERRAAELKHLVDVKMFENAKAIAAAAEHGDLRENADWKSAIEERDLLRARATKMQEELAKARTIQPENVPTNTVGVGSTVTLTRLSDGQTLDLTFLGPWDSNIDNRVYSYQTQLGQTLMGKPPGEVVSLKLGGEDEDYRIDATRPWREVRE